MKIITILTNGFEEVEAIATIALLKRSGIEVDIYALKDTKASGKHNLVIADIMKLGYDYKTANAIYKVHRGSMKQKLIAMYG